MMKKQLYAIGSLLAGFALMITVFNVNTVCWFYIHQPKLPDSALKMRKF